MVKYERQMKWIALLFKGSFAAKVTAARPGPFNQRDVATTARQAFCRRLLGLDEVEAFFSLVI